jgi:hypothetical protein
VGGPAQWLRRLDDDVLSGHVASRLIVALPLALFLGCLLGGGLGCVGGLFFGLLPRYEGDYAVIAFPYIGALIGGVLGCLLTVMALFRLRRR